jgi:hypothetical protein
MGYLSEVAIVIDKSVHDEFLKYLTAKVLEKGDTEFNPFSVLDSAEKRETEGAILFYWRWIKWYSETDAEIAAIMDALRRLDEEYYRYVRIGQELGDFEDEGYFEGPPYVSIMCKMDIEY